MYKQLLAVSVVVCLLGGGMVPAVACTNLIVTKGASADGSVFSTYTCDGRFHPHLRNIPPETHEPGEMLDITSWSGEVRDPIPDVLLGGPLSLLHLALLL